MKRIQLLFLFIIPLFTTAQTSSNLSLVGSYDYSGIAKANDIWGYVDAEGVEYALVGLETGFSVVSLADPSSPQQMFFISGQQTVWRDIKVWGNYAYVTSDNTTEGLLIVDLSDMTGNTYTYTTQDNNGDYMFDKAHNIFIDEFGKGYAFGGNVVAGGSQNDGALIFDVTQTDLSNNTLPTNLGHVDQFYLHDGMARGDTLWGSAIYEGKFFAVDVSDPANPEIFNGGLAFHETPNDFTHNCWISDDGNTLFTTDEVSGAYVGAYDVSDLSNIYELDRIQSSPDLGFVIPHNTHVMGNFLVTSYYTDGVVVHDATYPNYMLEVAHYDAYDGESDDFDGCWGAYPWLPSGLILSTDRNSSVTSQGVLWVLEPSFQQGCYLDGTITDVFTGDLLWNASVEISTNIDANTSSDLLGDYFTGLITSGEYDVLYSQVGYYSQIITVYLENGVLFTQDVQLVPEGTLTWNCIDNGCVEFTDGTGIYLSEIECESECIPDPTWNCVGADNFGSCIEILDGTGEFNSLEDCQEECLTSWDCINSSCVDYGWGIGPYTSLEECEEECVSLSWKCADGACVEFTDGTGQYTSLLDCEAECEVIIDPTWKCFDGDCYELADGTGAYTNLVDCEAECQEIIDPTWKCTDGACLELSDGSGPFTTLADCEADCTPLPSWDCVTGGCVDPADGSGFYSSLADCETDCHTSSINDDLAKQFLIFPNPTNGIVNIVFHPISSLESIQLSIMNSLGEFVYEEKAIVTKEFTKEVDLSNQPKGVYFLEIITNKGVVKKKLILQ